MEEDSVHVLERFDTKVASFQSYLSIFGFSFSFYYFSLVDLCSLICQPCVLAVQVFYISMSLIQYSRKSREIHASVTFRKQPIHWCFHYQPKMIQHY